MLFDTNVITPKEGRRCMFGHKAKTITKRMVHRPHQRNALKIESVRRPTSHSKTRRKDAADAHNDQMRVEAQAQAMNQTKRPR